MNGSITAGDQGFPPVPPPPPPPPLGAPGLVAAGRRARRVRDVVVLAAVAAVVTVVVGARSQVVYPVPVTHGAARVTNAAEILDAADEQFDALVRSQGGRIAADAGCWFFRPLGATLGAFPAEMIPEALLSYLPGGRDADAIDLVLCGPVQLGGAAELGGAAPGALPPWAAGIVTHRAAGDGSYRGELAFVMQAPVLPSTGDGLTSDMLVDVDGHHPDGDVIADPSWREVEGTGGGGPVPGAPASGPLPSLPPDLTLPPGAPPPSPPGSEPPDDSAPPDDSTPPDDSGPPDGSPPPLPPGVSVPPGVELPGGGDPTGGAA